MKYERFEQLPVWQAAMNLAAAVYSMTEQSRFARVRELKDQLRRAALSVSNNIAEGFERGTTAELLAFLYIARGSAGETRSMLLLCRRLQIKGFGPQSQISDLKFQISDLKSQTSNGSQISDLKSAISHGPVSDSELAAFKGRLAELIALAESCSRQIRAWADSLQNSDIKGQRHLNDAVRQAASQARSTEAFLQHLQDIRDQAGRRQSGDGGGGREREDGGQAREDGGREREDGGREQRLEQ